MIFAVFLLHTIGDLALLECSMSDRSQTIIPLGETIFSQDLCLIFRLVDIWPVDSLTLAILLQQLLAF